MTSASFCANKIESLSLTAPKENKVNFTTIQAGRGLAAILVILFHTSVIFSSNKYWNYNIAHGFFSFGFSGVEFFFVLSGFIMVYAHSIDFGKPRRLKTYFYKRFVRIYPMYWVITVITFILYVSTNNNRSNLIINSLFLVGTNNNAILTVAWTLFQEISFYIIFSSVIISKRFGSFLIISWLLCCLYFFDNTPPHYIFLPINILFGLGILSSLSYEKTLFRIML